MDALIVTTIFWSYVLVGFLCYQAGRKAVSRGTKPEPEVEVKEDPKDHEHRAWNPDVVVRGGDEDRYWGDNF